MISAYDYIVENVNVKIAPSRLHGVGIFALRDIQPGEELFKDWNQPSGKFNLTQVQLDSLEEGVRAHIYDMFQFSLKDGKWRFNVYLEQNCYWIFKSPTHWINSCPITSEPNIDLDNKRALKLIKAGTELLTKYGKYQKRQSHRAI